METAKLNKNQIAKEIDELNKTIESIEEINKITEEVNQNFIIINNELMDRKNFAIMSLPSTKEVLNDL